MSRLDDETPPPGWVPSKETLEMVRTAPMLDLDAHLAPLGGRPDVRDSPWLWTYYQSSPPRIISARTPPPPTLAPQFHSLRSRRLLAAWLAKYGARAVYSMAVEERWRPAVKWRKSV